MLSQRNRRGKCLSPTSQMNTYDAGASNKRVETITMLMMVTSFLSPVK